MDAASTASRRACSRQKSLTGLATYGDGLVANVKKLQTLTTGLTYQPAELANGAQDLLDEVASSKITGEEERYSHIDLLDFQANDEGAEQAFAALQPALQKIDPALTTTDLAARSPRSTRCVDKYRTTTERLRLRALHQPDRPPTSRSSPRRSRPCRSRCRRWRARSPTPESLTRLTHRRRPATRAGAASSAARSARPGVGRRARRRRLRGRPGDRAADARRRPRRATSVPFYGAHQAGIATPAQDRLAFAAFDVTTHRRRRRCRRCSGTWAAAAAQMTRGPADRRGRDRARRPRRSTPARRSGSAPATLTITVGFGPSLFDDRFGLAGKRPAALADLPALPGDDARAGAQRRRPLRAGLRRRPAGRLPRHPQLRPARPAAPRSCAGRSSASAARRRPRPRRQTAAQPDGLQGRHQQHQGRGRRRHGRLRLGRRRDRPALDARRQLPGRPPHPDADRVVGHRLPRRPGERLRPGQGQRRAADRQARVRHRRTSPRRTRTASRSSPPTRTSGWPRRRRNGGQKILRRGYSYTDGIDPDTGLLDAGLFFIAYQKDPRKQFVADPAPARRARRAQRVHPAHRQRAVRRAAGPVRGPATGGARRCSPDAAEGPGV